MAGKLRLEGNGGYYAGLESQESLIADVIWKLPATDGSVGQFMTSDGSLSLAWASSGYTHFVGVGGYANLAAALAAASAGSSILVTQGETISAPLDINVNNIKITFMPNVVIELDAGTADGIIVSATGVTIEGLQLEATHAATLTNLVRVSGDDNNIEKTRLRVNNAGLTVTNAVNLEGDFNYVISSARVVLGLYTNTVVDGGTDNDYGVRG
jgi:hypothetical protein